MLHAWSESPNSTIFSYYTYSVKKYLSLTMSSIYHIWKYLQNDSWHSFYTHFPVWHNSGQEFKATVVGLSNTAQHNFVIMNHVIILLMCSCLCFPYLDSLDASTDNLSVVVFGAEWTRMLALPQEVEGATITCPLWTITVDEDNLLNNTCKVQTQRTRWVKCSHLVDSKVETLFTVWDTSAGRCGP